MLRKTLIAAMLLGSSFAALTVHAEDKPKEQATISQCENLPNELKFDSGRVVLQRTGDHWEKIKGSKPSKPFVYVADDQRIYEFRYWVGNKFRCWDTGRTSGTIR